MHGPRSPWENFTLTVQTFEAFGFAEPLSRALTQCGYTTPTPIQVQALKPQLEGRDLLGMAETGSGKTATFVLPILQKLASEPIEPAPKQVLALILAPTRELAIQIDQEVASLSRNMRIRRAVVLGGVSKGPQINALKRGVHVLVATPGRLLDLVNMRTCDLSRVETLVLDEADRMFDMGFIRDIKKIVSLIPAKRRNALFSATMPDEIRKFAYDILKDPYRVDLSSKSVVVDRIDQKVMIVRTPEKQSRLHTLLADEACKRVIVFTRTKRGADRVADRLGMASISAAAFHGNKAQNARQRALNDFTMGHIRVLVATDIAARGIDVSNITHVVNFDMPLDPETYVHRVGRTARKGNSGIAISLCDPSERQEIKAIERLMKQTIEVISDVGGEVLPMPERRPHQHATNGSRRDANGRGRNGSPREDSGRTKHTRPNGPHRGDGRGERSAGRSGDRSHGDRAHSATANGGRRSQWQPTDVAPDSGAVFGVSARPERSQRANRDRPERDHKEQAHRGERRPQHSRGEGGHRSPEHRHGERRGDGQRSNGHRSDTSRSGERISHEGRPAENRSHDSRSGEHRPVRRSDAPRGDRPQGNHRTGDGSAREGHHASEKRGHGRGRETGHAWAGSNTPKFMKRRDDGRGNRPGRNPAS
jgi:ATP-dependent RNA helicase RhlE